MFVEDASLDEVDPEIAGLIKQEKRRQVRVTKLWACGAPRALQMHHHASRYSVQYTRLILGCLPLWPFATSRSVLPNHRGHPNDHTTELPRADYWPRAHCL